MGGRNAFPPRNRETTSLFAVVVVLVLLSFAVLVVFVSFVAFLVLVVPFVFAAHVVCAAGAVLHVVVAELVIRQNNKEASRKQKGKTHTRHRTKNRNEKQTK
jgi:archaellum biogenesis protein FlaJ (TadC family)